LLGLTGLTVASFFVDRSAAARAQNPQLAVKVIAHQWWWEVIYTTGDLSKTVHTANELHLPVGVEAQVRLESSDVIHSFWVPNLAGKQDLIPGRTTDIQLLPTKTGLYRGQCAEFCGMQHTNMALVVTVENRDDFLRWMEAQSRPAAAPASPLELAGYRYVTTRECSSCHNISGTPAGGQVGPDLTHLASRRTIGAGTLPMNRGNLYGWVADPQSHKPGNQMPTIGLAPNDLHAVVAYLERLK
jgi:cytochrome c oxidase subunit 2